MICPYCGSGTRLVDSAKIYGGRSYGWAYVCSRFPDCDAYVGCHKGTQKPLGRLADKALRDAKQRAHGFFDLLWQAKMKLTGCSKYAARNGAYTWLAEQLNLPRKKCHIGMFDIQTCRHVVEICTPFVRKVQS